MEIILASSSAYRKQLLERLNIAFRCIAPDTDETPLPGESPEQLAVRLSLLKARSLRTNYPGAIIIGSDQVASLEGEILSKPGTHAAATRQLEKSSGKAVLFHTGLALIGPGTNEELSCCEQFRVLFRTLDSATIERYLRADRPYDCAGSFKAESLGIGLFESTEGTDPTSLIGLPLIALTGLLAQVGVQVP